MTDHLFISYSSADALSFAYTLHDTLEAGPPHVPAWLDKRDIDPGRDWDTQIDEGIATCSALLFVMTPDSVEDQSVCKLEWSRAFRYKKAVVPLLLTRGVKVPFRLESRQHIDFSGNFDQAIAKLRQHIEFLKSPAGELQRMKDQRADAQRDLRRETDETQIARIKDEITQLDADIVRLQAVVDDPAGAAQRVQQKVENEINQPGVAHAAPTTTVRLVNSPPSVPPDYFQNRHFETGQLVEFLRTDTLRMATVVGRGGLGKTAMVCRLLRALERHSLPDDLGEMKIDNIVYLLFSPMRRITFSKLVTDLGKVLPEGGSQELELLQQDSKLSVTEKVFRLVEYFHDSSTVVLLDNFEDAVTSDGKLTDAEFDEALRALLKAPQHRIKVIVTTRVKPQELLLVQPVAQRVIELDKGLESPYAENVLRAMDSSGALGLKTASDDILRKLQERTLGYPRALEALVAILAADRETQIDDLVSMPLPENVVEALVGEAFIRLDSTAQRVMQALAIYGQPMPSVAVDYLLEPFVVGVDSSELLKRLVNMHFVRQAGPRGNRKYFLHPVDRDFALERVPKGDRRDPAEVIENDEWEFTRCCLYLRAAYYFLQKSLPDQEWQTPQDLDPNLAAYEALLNGDDLLNAGNQLVIMSPYLFNWGRYRTIIELHLRLINHELMETEGLRSDFLIEIEGLLGRACLEIGQPAPAIDFLDQAASHALEMEDPGAAIEWLCPLGDALVNVQDLDNAVQAYQMGLDLVHQMQDALALELESPSDFPTTDEDDGTIDPAEQIAFINESLNALKVKQQEYESSLGRAYGQLGDLPLMEQHFRQAISLADELGESLLADDLLTEMLSLKGDFREVIRRYEANLRQAQQESNHFREAALWSGLGGVHTTNGYVQNAIDCYEKSREIYKAVDQKRLEAGVMDDLGRAYEYQTLYDKALVCYQEALALAAEVGDQQGQSIYLTSLGNITLVLKRFDDAVLYFKQALEIAGMHNDMGRMVFALSGLSNSYVMMEDAENALHYATESLTVARQTRNPSLELEGIMKLGNVMTSFWRLDEALEQFRVGLDRSRSLQDRTYEILFLSNLGRVFGDIGEIAESIDYFETSLTLSQAAQIRGMEASAHTSVGNAYSYQGRFDKMQTHYTAALSIARELKDSDAEIFGLVNLAEILRDQGQFEAAKEPNRQALAITHERGSDYTKFFVHFDLAETYLFLGEIEAGLQEIRAAQEYSVPERLHGALTLYGVFLLRSGDGGTARQQFDDAVKGASEIVAKDARLYSILDVKALALTGLALATAKQADPATSGAVVDFIKQAVEAYQAARMVTASQGVVNRVLRLHDALAVVAEGDAALMAQLAEVRKAAAGEG
ncbi:MAG: tetratricopeptide repeat protein [Anaerolineae bacterium]|nr:tetratricopeptide repeat protein [Anaerolineae bacterium]